MIATVLLEAAGVACNWSTEGPMIAIVSLMVIGVDSKGSAVGLPGLCVGMSAPVRTWADGQERTKGSIIAYFENNVYLSQAERCFNLSLAIK